MKVIQTILLMSLAIFTAQVAQAAVAPMPLISRSVPAFASDNSAQAGQANNANYDDNWRSGRTPSAGAPNWLAYDLSSKHPTTVVLVWYNDGTYGYNWDLQGGQGYSVPTDYTIDVNSAAGGTLPTTGWTTAVTVSGSHYHSREHAFSMAGKNWVRINVTGASTASQNTDVSINMDVYDTSAGIQDTWLFTGDSITAGGMKHTGTTFSQGVNASDPHFPLEENAGIGGWTAALVLGQIDSWLAIYPGHFVTINLGTNDVNSSPGDNTAINACIANLTSIANKVIAAGKVPIIPHIPWANLAAIQSNGPVLNSKIDALIAGNPQIIAGPDLYTFFQNNPGLISSDNLHPSDPAGWAAYRNQWSTWAISKIYGGTITVPAAPTGLTATAGNTQVALAWNASSGATSYTVKRSTVSGSGYANVSSPSTTSYTNTGLTNGTTYYFVVSATNSAGTSGNSAQASATPVAPTQAQIIAGTATIDGTVEAAWNSATAYALGKTSGIISGASDCSATWQGMWDSTNLYLLVNVTDDVKKNDSTNPWDDDSVEVYLDADHNGGTSYDANDRQIELGWGDASAVEGGGRGIAGVTFAKADPTGTTYRIETKIPWAVEAFTASANAVIGLDVHVNDDDDGAARDGKIMWTDGTDQAWTNPSLFGTAKLNAGGGGVPPVPTGLSATPGSGQVSLSWTASSGATSYNVKRSTVNGSGYVTAASPTGTTDVDVNLLNGTTYYYVVTAVNTSGESGNSSQVSATPTTGIPPAPTGLTATAGNAQVALSWNASSGATAYDVKRSTVSGSGYATVSSPTTTSYTNTGLTNGTIYYFVVDAKNASGTSANSAQVSATPAASGGDASQYNFESSAQGWVATGGITSGVATSTTKAYLGTHSLAVTFNGGAAGTADVHVPSPGVPDGRPVTWHIWIPAGSTITDVKPYIAGGTWSGNYYGVITTGAWWTLTQTPAAGTAPDTSLGIQIDTNGAWSGTVYIDSVSW